MRKLICLLLVVALCASLAGTVFATAVNSPGQGGAAPHPPGGGGNKPTVPDDGGDKPTTPGGGGNKPTTPGPGGDTPTTPDLDENPSDNEAPKTGDRTNVGLWLLLMILALIALVIILIVDYKYMRQ